MDAVLCWNPIRSHVDWPSYETKRPKENVLVDGKNKKHEYFYTCKKGFSEVVKFTNLKNVSLFSK